LKKRGQLKGTKGSVEQKGKRRKIEKRENENGGRSGLLKKGSLRNAHAGSHSVRKGVKEGRKNRLLGPGKAPLSMIQNRGVLTPGKPAMGDGQETPRECVGGGGLVKTN